MNIDQWIWLASWLCRTRPIPSFEISVFVYQCYLLSSLNLWIWKLNWLHFLKWLFKIKFLMVRKYYLTALSRPWSCCMKTWLEHCINGPVNLIGIVQKMNYLQGLKNVWVLMLLWHDQDILPKDGPRLISGLGLPGILWTV
jgi:hypothetical protein